MEMLQYKTFVWPNNPHTYKEETARDPIYVTKDGVTSYKKMGKVKRSITGSGAFFGENAYEQYLALVTVFEDASAGDLVHPVFGTRYCYFTGLEMTQEPRADYISYRFEFTGAQANGEVPK